MQRDPLAGALAAVCRGEPLNVQQIEVLWSGPFGALRRCSPVHAVVPLRKRLKWLKPVPRAVGVLRDRRRAAEAATADREAPSRRFSGSLLGLSQLYSNLDRVR